jgi:hypothetical protein
MANYNLELDTMTHEYKEALAEDCEDFLLSNHIPLHSHSYDNIILQAFSEGYNLQRMVATYPSVES